MNRPRLAAAATALTVGAGIVFSSVGHGSAFDIAGRGIADPTGILRAIHLVAGVGTGGETLNDVRHSHRRN